MTHEYFEHDAASDYPRSFTIGKRGAGKKLALRNLQKKSSIRNIRLNATSVINELENLLDIYSEEHNERMYKKTMVLLTSLNNFIVESYNKEQEEKKNWGTQL